MKTMETFYHECVDTKIAQCETRASRLNGKSPCTQIQADLKRAQLIFLEDQREKLVLGMLESRIGRDLNRISEFLNKAFFTEFLVRAGSSDNGNANTGHGKRISESYEYYGKHVPRLRKMPDPIQANDLELRDSLRIERLFELPWSDGSLLSDDD